MNQERSTKDNKTTDDSTGTDEVQNERKIIYGSSETTTIRDAGSCSVCIYEGTLVCKAKLPCLEKLKA